MGLLYFLCSSFSDLETGLLVLQAGFLMVNTIFQYCSLLSHEMARCVDVSTTFAVNKLAVLGCVKKKCCFCLKLISQMKLFQNMLPFHSSRKNLDSYMNDVVPTFKFVVNFLHTMIIKMKYFKNHFRLLFFPSENQYTCNYFTRYILGNNNDVDC